MTKVLRHPLAVSKLEELAEGTFQNAIGEIDALDPKGVKRVVFCSGKVYYDLLDARRKAEQQDVARQVAFRGLLARGLHTYLLDGDNVRHGLNPYDEKRMRVARKTVKAEPAPERVELPSLATPRDPVAQPEYRPGSRISAGVVGVPRSPEAPAMPAPAAAAAPASAPVNPATPSPAATPAAPAVATPAPAVATAAPAVAVSEAPGPRRRGRMGGLALRLDTGETIPVTAPILFGRDPDAAAHPGARAVPLTDTTRTLSKTHALVQPVAGGLEIIDRRSTNGCGVIRGGIETELASGGSATVAEGDAIRLGDRTADVVQIAPLQT